MCGMIRFYLFLTEKINKEEDFLILNDSTGNVKVAGFSNIRFISQSQSIGESSI
jgi:hypothetical protein